VELEDLKIKTRLTNEKFTTTIILENFETYSLFYESIKREPKIRGIKKCRCDERLQTKTKVYHESRKRELKRRLINEGRCDERLKRFLFF
jgi:hypothetical protein